MAGLNDISTLQDAISSISTRSTSDTAQSASLFPIRVLLWNIHGKPPARARNLLVPRVVERVNPDILLLQETKTDKLVQSIIKSTDRRYKEVRAKERTESRILYADKYAEIPRDDKLFYQQDGHIYSLNRVLQESIQNVIPRNNQRELRRGVVQGATNVYNHRLSIVGLKVKQDEEDDQVRNPDILIFLSFHNVYKKANSAGREQIAKEFCRLVAQIHELTGCAVIGGAELNYQLPQTFQDDFNVIQYDPTERRLHKKIDYFIVALNDTAEIAEVEALNFINTKEGEDLLHPLMNGLLRQDLPPHNENEYKKALDHDPLKCEILTPP